MRSNIFVCKPVALYYKKLFCRILSRLGIERDVFLLGVYSQNIISQNKTEYFILSKVAEVSTFTNSLVAESLKCSRKRFSDKTLLPCGNHFYVSVRLRPKALCCRVVRPSARPYINKYLFRIRSGVGGQGQLDFYLPGGQAGVKTNLNKTVGGPGNYYFFQ